MSPAPAAERRTHARHPLPLRVEFHHGPSRRSFPARCVDISRGGMLMFVPAKVPLKAGDSLRMTLGAVARPEFSDMGDGPVNASVVRVDRQALIESGQLAVAVRFLGM